MIHRVWSVDYMGQTCCLPIARAESNLHQSGTMKFGSVAGFQRAFLQQQSKSMNCKIKLQEAKKTCNDWNKISRIPHFKLTADSQGAMVTHVVLAVLSTSPVAGVWPKGCTTCVAYLLVLGQDQVFTGGMPRLNAWKTVLKPTKGITLSVNSLGDDGLFWMILDELIWTIYDDEHFESKLRYPTVDSCPMLGQWSS